MKNQEQRDWSSLLEEDLDYIIDHDSNKRIVRIAKAEKKRRQPPELRSVQINTRPSESASRVEIVGVNLSFRDWFQVIFKAYLALICVNLIFSIPMLLLYLLFLRVVFAPLF